MSSPSVAAGPRPGPAAGAPEKLTLTKALAELKLLGKRIDSKMKRLHPVAMKKGPMFQSYVKSQAEFERDTHAEWQSLFALMERRKKIKTALVVANATNVVDVDGERMTIADAIEKKSALDTERELVLQMRRKLVQMQDKVDAHNDSVAEKLSKLLEAAYAKKDSQLAKDDYDRIAKPFNEANQAKLVDPLNLKKQLDAMEEAYERFLSEVDVCLSVANATTFIEL